MKGLMEGMVAIIISILLLQAIFPKLLEQIISTTLFAIFVSIVILIVGGAVWLVIKYYGD